MNVNFIFPLLRLSMQYKGAAQGQQGQPSISRSLICTYLIGGNEAGPDKLVSSTGSDSDLSDWLVKMKPLNYLRLS